MAWKLAAASDKIVWTALPQGVVTKNGVRCLWATVFVSPRLYGASNGVLSSFPDFADWPSIVGQMSFGLNFGSSFQIPAAPLQSFAGDSALWKSLFQPGTYVKGYQFEDNTQRRIVSYPVRMVIDFLAAQYTSAAASSPSELPAASALLSGSAFGALTFNRMDPLVKAQLDELLTKNKALSMKDVATAGGNPAKTALTLAKSFHQPTQIKQQPLPRFPQDKDKFENMLDFHQMVSALANFPEMMRRLGLLLDLYLPAANVPVSPGNNPLWVQLTSHDFDAARDYAPQVAYTLIGDWFMPAADPSSLDLSAGMLPFNELAQYELIQIDPDGAALKAMDFANNISKAQNKKSQDTPSSYGVPTMRSGGFSVAKVDRAVQLATRFQAAKGHETDLQGSQPTLMYAEDLMRGYRVDVWDSVTTKWHALNSRTGAYSYLDGNGVQQPIASGVVDEGWVQTAVTQSSDPSVPQSQKDLSLHESLFTWKGWSLSVTRPGQTIDPQDEANPVQPVPASQLKLTATFTPTPGTLPRLRFGRRYRIMARMVDLGGGGLELGQADTAKATGEVPYLRFEPVPAPFVALKKELSSDDDAAESLQRIVIRSFNDLPSKDTTATQEVGERHVAPPRTSQLMAEEHGMFEDPHTGAMKYDAATYASIASMDKARLGMAADNNPIDANDQMALPYMPDPLSAGASLLGLPGATNKSGGLAGSSGLAYTPVTGPGAPIVSVTLVPFGKQGDWPGLSPFRMRVKEGNSQPAWDPTARVLDVFLPKSGQAILRLSSYLAGRDMEKMGILYWLAEAHALGRVSDAAYQAAISVAEQGRHWMVTPFREVHLVHAVQQPIGMPEFESLEPKRGMGWTYAMLSGKVKLHGPSTVKVDVQGRWEERRDDPSDPANDPVKDRVHGTSRAFDMPVALFEKEANFYLEAAKRHDFHDTIYRRVYYKAVTTSRFKEYMPKAIRDDPKAPVFRESKEAPIDVPSSAKPAAPSILYAVPIFGWKGAAGTSVRKGRALRVYLNRPWFSSGDNEQLGVILWPGKMPTDTDGLEEAKQAVTMIGSDPIWGSDSTPQNLTITDFGNAGQSSPSGLPLDELKGKPVDVAAHDVGYDPDRRLWYCDIAIDSRDSYFPFVRLALARFQPISVSGAHLSKVILADFAQLAPDRTLSLVRLPSSVRVTVTGHTYSSGPWAAALGTQAGSQVEVSLERYDASIGTNLGWVAEPKATVYREGPPGPPVMFSGTVSFPPPVLNQEGQAPQLPQRYRVVVKEYETLPADATKPEMGFASEPWPRAPARRLVYAEQVEL